MKCPVHPQYEGIGKPRKEPHCSECWVIWKNRQKMLEQAALKLPQVVKK